MCIWIVTTTSNLHDLHGNMISQKPMMPLIGIDIFEILQSVCHMYTMYPYFRYYNSDIIRLNFHNYPYVSLFLDFLEWMEWLYQNAIPRNSSRISRWLWVILDRLDRQMRERKRQLERPQGFAGCSDCSGGWWAVRIVRVEVASLSSAFLEFVGKPKGLTRLLEGATPLCWDYAHRMATPLFIFSKSKEGLAP